MRLSLSLPSAHPEERARGERNVGLETEEGGGVLSLLAVSLVLLGTNRFSFKKEKKMAMQSCNMLQWSNQAKSMYAQGGGQALTRRRAERER